MSTTFTLFSHNFGSGTFGSNEKYLMPFGYLVGDKTSCIHETPCSLVQVDDVNPVLFTVDIRFHFGIPKPCTVSEMNAGFKQVPK